MRNKTAFLTKLHQGFDGLLGCVEAGRFGCFWRILIRFGLFFFALLAILLLMFLSGCARNQLRLIRCCYIKCHLPAITAKHVGKGPVLSIFWGAGLRKQSGLTADKLK
jgi:hypothetical protein